MVLFASFTADWLVEISFVSNNVLDMYSTCITAMKIDKALNRHSPRYITLHALPTLRRTLKSDGVKREVANNRLSGEYRLLFISDICGGPVVALPASVIRVCFGNCGAFAP